MKLTSPEHIRWRSGCYSEALRRATSSATFYEAVSLCDLAAAVSARTAEGLIDLKGLDLTSSTKEQTRISPGRHSNLDISKLEGHDVLINKSTFKDCKFEYSRWSNGVIRECLFTDCSFRGTVWNATPLGVRSMFTGCDFTEMSGRGEFFSFGRENKFVDCKFLEIEVKRVNDHSLVFERCQFSGVIVDGKFRGPSYIRKKRLGSLKMLLDVSLSPTRFIDCDFSYLMTPPDCFETGVIINP